MDPVQSQYGSSSQQIQPHHHGGQLAFTGFDAVPLIILAVVLAGLGFMLRLFRHAGDDS